MPRAIAARPTSIDSLGEPQDRLQRQPECISRSRTSAGARYRENRRLVGPPHKRGIQWNCQTTDYEKKVAEDTLPTSADENLSGPARSASSAPRLLEYRPEQRLVYVPFPHASLYANQVLELRLIPALSEISECASGSLDTCIVPISEIVSKLIASAIHPTAHTGSPTAVGTDLQKGCIAR